MFDISKKDWMRPIPIIEGNQLKAVRAELRVFVEGILPQDCNLETLPEFLVCWADLQTSELPAPIFIIYLHTCCIGSVSLENSGD